MNRIICIRWKIRIFFLTDGKTTDHVMVEAKLNQKKQNFNHIFMIVYNGCQCSMMMLNRRMSMSNINFWVANHTYQGIIYIPISTKMLSYGSFNFIRVHCRSIWGIIRTKLSRNIVYGRVQLCNLLSQDFAGLLLSPNHTKHTISVWTK